MVHDRRMAFLMISEAGMYSLVIESLGGGPRAYSFIHSPLAACISLLTRKEFFLFILEHVISNLPYLFLVITTGG